MNKPDAWIDSRTEENVHYQTSNGLTLVVVYPDEEGSTYEGWVMTSPISTPSTRGSSEKEVVEKLGYNHLLDKPEEEE